MGYMGSKGELNVSIIIEDPKEAISSEALLEVIQEMKAIEETMPTQVSWESTGTTYYDNSNYTGDNPYKL